MFASDFKKWAREVLRGHWGTAVGVCLVAALLGGGIDLVSVLYTGDQTTGMIDLVSTGAWPVMVTVTIASLLVALVLGGALTLGLTHYFTNLAAHRPSKLSDLFARFRIWHKGIWMNIVIAFFVSLWSLLGVLPVTLLCGGLLMGRAPENGAMLLVSLLIILASFPGWIASYRYAMTPYVLAEFTDLSAMDALRESKRLMKGKKWRLFCLRFSFIGWSLLVSVVAVIGTTISISAIVGSTYDMAAMVSLVATLASQIGALFLNSYMMAADAAFYMDVTGRSNLRYTQPTE